MLLVFPRPNFDALNQSQCTLYMNRHRYCGTVGTVLAGTVGTYGTAGRTICTYGTVVPAVRTGTVPACRG